MAPRLAGDGLHPHALPGRGRRRGVLAVEAQPGVHRRVPARLRRPRADRRQRFGRHDAAVPVHDDQLDGADVGLRGDRRGRQVPRRRRLLLQPRARHGRLLAGGGAVVVAGAHAGVLAHPDRARRSAGLGVVRPVPARAWAARALPVDLLLRGLPPVRLGDLGPPRRRARDRRGATGRVPVRPVVDRAVVADRPDAAPRQPVDRGAGDAGAARRRLLGGEQAVGADGPRRGPPP